MAKSSLSRAGGRAREGTVEHGHFSIPQPPSSLHVLKDVSPRCHGLAAACGCDTGGPYLSHKAFDDLHLQLIAYRRDRLLLSFCEGQLRAEDERYWGYNGLSQPSEVVYHSNTPRRDTDTPLSSWGCKEES
eukprot:scaffold7351_cov28-Tisochrysis_lutea.AAC.5